MQANGCMSIEKVLLMCALLMIQVGECYAHMLRSCLKRRMLSAHAPLTPECLLQIVAPATEAAACAALRAVDVAALPDVAPVDTSGMCATPLLSFFARSILCCLRVAPPLCISPPRLHGGPGKAAMAGCVCSALDIVSYVVTPAARAANVIPLPVQCAFARARAAGAHATSCN